jgi:hypothetical protein
MMKQEDRSATCLRCPQREREFTPPVCHCTVSGKDIIDHITIGECPIGRYALTICIRCNGAHDVSRCPIPADTTPAIEQQRAQQGGCCGPPT